MDKMYIAKLMYHKWEEEPISGIERGYKGTFAIFFYGCNLHCVYCQNSRISRMSVNELKDDRVFRSKYPKLEKIALNPEELAKKMIEAEKDKVASISFITGVWYRDLIIKTIKLAKDTGLKIPIVYNSSGYETAVHIRELKGLIDIYLPDFKYFDDELGKKYSNVFNYREIASECLQEMYEQVGKHNFDNIKINHNDGNIYRGVIVRHLVLPSHTEDSKKILKYLYDNYKNDIYYSIMSQYTPILNNDGLEKYPELKRKLTKREYEKVTDYALSLGIDNAYIQDMEVAKESFIPDF